MGKERNKRTGKGPTQPQPCLRRLPCTAGPGLMRSILPPQCNDAGAERSGPPEP